MHGSNLAVDSIGPRLALRSPVPSSPGTPYHGVPVSIHPQQTRAFLNDLWSMRPVSRPAYRLAGWARQPYVRPHPAPPGSIDPRFEPRFLQKAAEAAEADLLDDDGLPLLNSYLHIGVHASAFGCLILRDEGEPKVTPVIQGLDEFGKLREPCDSDETRLNLDYLAYLARHRAPGWLVSHLDTQGPTDVASLVWDYSDLLVSALEAPDKIRWLLDRITRYTIDLAHRQLALVPDLSLNHNPGIYLPPGMGISASEDLLAVVSPSWYRQFGLPYNNQLSEAFGGIFIHSCGDFTQNLPVLRQHHKLRGVNFNLGEVKIAPLLDALAGRCVLNPRLALPQGEAKLREYVSYLDAHNLDRTHHFYAIDNGGWPLDRALALLRELGIAPPASN